MALVRTIIKNAYRKAGIVALGANVNSNQAAVGLELLGDLYLDLYVNGTLGQVKDVYVDTNNYEACEYDRILVSDGSFVVTFPSIIDDGNGGFRPPRDGAIIIVQGQTTDAPKMVIYEAALATWQRFDAPTLTLAGTAPLSVSHKEDIEALLAVYLADERGIPIGAVLARKASLAKYHLSHRANVASSVQVGSFF